MATKGYKSGLMHPNSKRYTYEEEKQLYTRELAHKDNTLASMDELIAERLEAFGPDDATYIDYLRVKSEMEKVFVEYARKLKGMS